MATPANAAEPTAHLGEETNDASAGRVVQSILYIGGGTILARIVAFFATAYLARTLAPAGFGIIGFASALFVYFSLLVSGGINAVGAREVAHRPDEASSIAASVTLARLALALLAAAGIALLALFLPKPPEVKLVVLLMAPLAVTLALDTSWAYKGLERNGRVCLALVFAQLIYLAAVWAFVRGPGDIALVPIAQLAGELGAALLLLIPLLRWGRLRLDLHEAWRILAMTRFLAVTKLLRALIFTFDLVLIGFWLGETDAGLYTAPYRICFLLLAIAATIQVAYLPAMTRASRHGSHETSAVADRSLALQAAVGAPFVVGGILLAAPLLTGLFGADYRPAADCFRLLLLSVGFIFLHSALHNVFVAHHRMNVEMWNMAAAAAANVVLNLLLIPRFGLTGAAAATAAAEGLYCIGAVATIYRMKIRLGFRAILRPLLAAAVMGAVISALSGGKSLTVAILVGAAIYLPALVLFRGVPQDLLPHLRRVFPIGLVSPLK
ncbi:MAG: oligosaccharide flippase family protein [Chthoniobacterales bacterium]